MDSNYSYLFIENDFFNINNMMIVMSEKDINVSEGEVNSLKQKFSSNLKLVGKSLDEIVDIIKDYTPDVLITLGWRKIIPKNVFGRVNLSINLHPALLPEYRGYHPLPYLLMNDESEHGLTAHLISEEVDAGDILAQHRFKINKFTTVKSLIDMSRREMPKFLTKILHDIEKEKLNFTKQDFSKIKIIAKKRTPVDSELDVNKSLKELFNEIRACDNDRFPPFFYIHEEKVYLKIWRENEYKENPNDI